MAQQMPLSLPEEVLNRIVALVYPRSELMSVILASKALRRIALPHLYSTMHIANGGGNYSLKFLRPITFNILKHPELANLVQCLELRAPYDNDLGGNDTGLSWPEDDGIEQILRRSVDGLGYSKGDVQKLVNAAHATDNESAPLVLLLVSLPNLQRLHLSTSFQQDNDFLTDALSTLSSRHLSSAPRSMPFQYLTEVVIWGSDEKYPNDPELFGACLGLPALRKLFGFRLGYNSYEGITRALTAIPPESSPVELIELRYSKLDKEDLFSMLKAPKCLNEFAYEIGNTWAWTAIVLPHISQALSPHRNSLQELSLTHDVYYPFTDYDDEGGDDLSPISLADFTAVKSLRIAPLYLFGHEPLYSRPEFNSENSEADFCKNFCQRFPPNVENLHITFCEYIFSTERDAKYLSAAVETLLHQKSRFLPHLVTFTIEGSLGRDAGENGSEEIQVDDMVTRAQAVVELALSIGLKATIINNSCNEISERRDWGIDTDYFC